MKGYAIATDRAMTRVDESVNGGRHGSRRRIEDHGNARWRWTLRHATLDIPPVSVNLPCVPGMPPGRPNRPSLTISWNFRDTSAPLGT